jgi:hypothetical protein
MAGLLPELQPARACVALNAVTMPVAITALSSEGRMGRIVNGVGRFECMISIPLFDYRYRAN